MRGGFKSSSLASLRGDLAGVYSVIILGRGVFSFNSQLKLVYIVSLGLFLEPQGQLRFPSTLYSFLGASNYALSLSQYSISISLQLLSLSLISQLLCLCPQPSYFTIYQVVPLTSQQLTISYTSYTSKRLFPSSISSIASSAPCL